MKPFSSETLNFFLQKVLFLLQFGSWQNYMSSANLVAEIHQKLCNTRVLSTGEPCTCEYVTLLQSFRRGTLSIHWYIAQKLLKIMTNIGKRFSRFKNIHKMSNASASSFGNYIKVFDHCILTGRVLKLVLYDFSSNFTLNIGPVKFF